MELSYLLAVVVSWIVVSVPASLVIATFIAGGPEAQVQVVTTAGSRRMGRHTRVLPFASSRGF